MRIGGGFCGNGACRSTITLRGGGGGAGKYLLTIRDGSIGGGTGGRSRITIGGGVIGTGGRWRITNGGTSGG